MKFYRFILVFLSFLVGCSSVTNDQSNREITITKGQSKRQIIVTEGQSKREVKATQDRLKREVKATQGRLKPELNLTKDQLKREITWKNDEIARLEANNEALERKIVELSVRNKNLQLKTHTVSGKEIDKAFKIVKGFSTAPDNADTEANYQFIGKVVENIDPVNTGRKVELLISICRDYTPTDYIYSGTACRKLLLYGELLLPGVADETIMSKKSPLLGVYKK